MLRVVPFKQRTLGIGVHWTFLRLLGNIKFLFFLKYFLIKIKNLYRIYSRWRLIWINY